METSFNKFWEHPLSAPVEELYDGLGLMQKNVSVNDGEVQEIYADLHRYAKNPENFAPQVREAITNTPQVLLSLAR
jgi:putative cardiolipin synthase